MLSPDLSGFNNQISPTVNVEQKFLDVDEFAFLNKSRDRRSEIHQTILLVLKAIIIEVFISILSLIATLSKDEVSNGTNIGKSMLLGNFVFNNTFYIILNWLPSYFHDNYPDAKSWIFNVVPWLIVVPCTLLSGFLADWMVTLEGFYPSLLCMALVLACCGFHNSGILLNPQDIAPMNGGQVFGVMSTVGTIPGFTGVYLTGYILSKWHSWSTVFHCAIFGNLVGWMIYAIFGSSKSIA
ncbi:hypothetical protein ACTXT7_016938 [Hymenolepis weldensis]